MASVSFSATRGSLNEAGITEGTSAPGAGDIEIRIDLTKNLTKREIEEAFGVFFRFLSDPIFSTTVPF